ncbi:glycosyltransferase family 4 protein [Candidatus Daviesbacteria bacterium]|nr:glycosyltransferase family 4 protein [Candidatus Daviesbacteria bacterium]
MKILQIASPWVDTPPDNYGGTEWVIANLVKGLSDLGHQVTLFATKTSKAISNIKYIFKRSLLSQGISWTAGLPAFIHYYEAFKEAFKYDVVHAHIASSTDLIVMPFLADLTKQGIPNLMTIHSRWPYDRYSNMDKTLIKLYAKDILAVNISKSMHKTLPKGFRDGGFVYNSLDTSTIKFNPKGGKYLTWLGKIIPEKGTVEAIKIAKAAGEQLVFAGIVDTYYEKSVKYWKEKVKPLIDGKQIQFLGPANLRLKNRLLGGAKAFLNPINWDEPFGMVMVESMAAGTPVISFKRGAAPELIVNNKTGFLVKDKQEMVKAIKRVGEIDRKVCRLHVEENFSPYTAALQYLKIYRKEMYIPAKRYTKVRAPIISIPKSGNILIPGSQPKKNLFREAKQSHGLYAVAAQDTLNS